MKELYNKLALVQNKLKAPKNQKNNFGNYNYRSCEDILEAVKPLLPEGTVVFLQDDVIHFSSTHSPITLDVVVKDNTGKMFTKHEVVNFDRFYIRATATITDGVDSIVVTALAREEDSKKGMDGSQVSGAASSYARKYALNGLFLIDDTKDADTQDNTTGVGVSTTRVTPTTTKAPVVTKTPVAVKVPTAKKAEEVFDGQLPADPVVHDSPVAYTKKSGEIARDEKGHTACVGCGVVVSPKVEEYSIKQHGKVLCMKCQLKERAVKS